MRASDSRQSIPPFRILIETIHGIRARCRCIGRANPVNDAVEPFGARLDRSAYRPLIPHFAKEGEADKGFDRRLGESAHGEWVLSDTFRAARIVARVVTPLV